MRRSEFFQFLIRVQAAVRNLIVIVQLNQLKDGQQNIPKRKSFTAQLNDLWTFLGEKDADVDKGDDD